jgi:copper chaperone
MIEFDVDDMTCGHCASAIARAVRDADQTARVDVEVAARRVRVWPSAGASVDDFAVAIREAGYNPVPVAHAD